MSNLMLETPLRWQGGTGSDADPHVCPFNEKGMSLLTCASTSGAHVHSNSQCGGTWREQGKVVFGPCNSIARRCRTCVEMGQRGLKANAVVNVEDGTCEEHANGATEAPRGFRLPADPRTSRPLVTVGTCAPRPVVRVEPQPLPPPRIVATPAKKSPREYIVDEKLVESGAKNVPKLNERRLLMDFE